MAQRPDLQDPPATGRVAGSGRRGAVLAVAAEEFAGTGYARTSVRQIADRLGILPGSLYHHFDSKEAIAVELVRTMLEELDELRRHALARREEPVPSLRRFVGDGAAFFGRHRAALELCAYEPPTTAGPELRQIVRGQPAGLGAALRVLTARVERADRFRTPGADRRLLRRTLAHGVLVPSLALPDSSPIEFAETLFDVVFDGLWADGAALDRDGTRATDAVLADVAQRWSKHRPRPAGRRAEILESARAEFARRGFEATTMRDIADAAGFPVAGIYRHFASKDAVLGHIVGRFSDELLWATEQVLGVVDDPVVALDGVGGLMALAGRAFHREYAIVQTWWRQAPAAEADEAFAGNRRRLAILRSLLADGLTAGSLVSDHDVDLLAACVREVLWLPFQVSLHPDAARTFFRESWGRGALNRPSG